MSVQDSLEPADESVAFASTPLPSSAPWYALLTRYHWFVLGVAALGWLFDCLDQQLFILARQPAMRELLPAGSTSSDINAHAANATCIFLMGWAVGGLIFGVLGDRIGRARTMLITILLYSLFTGLSALSVGFWDFAFYRFLTGLGVGGEFAVGVALVAETMPERARPYALMVLQALSAVGNISAALITIGVSDLPSGWPSAWRLVFVIGALPALLAAAIRGRLREPERWQSVSHEDAVARQLGSYRALFSDPRWRRRALIGLVLGFAGVVGLWGVGFFTPDLVEDVLRRRFEEEAGTLTPEISRHIAARVGLWKGITSIMLNIGACLGMMGFGIVTQRIGRRPAFAIAFVLAGLSTAAVFTLLRDFSQIFWMVPIMGFCQLSLFAGYAIYFPELFPTYLRSTGTSFCYNVGRFVAASGPALLALLITAVYKDTAEPLRYAGLTMCAVFLLGLLVLPFAPETRGQPLPG